MYDSYAAMEDIGGAETKVDIISFYVLKDDPAKTIDDAKIISLVFFHNRTERIQIRRWLR